MKRNILLQIFIGCCIIMMTSCGNSNQNTSNELSSIQAEESIKQKAAGLTTQLLGNYHGIQPSYFLKNQYGEDMVLNGNKIPVPSIDYKFLLKENNVVSLQQINLEDNSRVYYDGEYKIILDDSNTSKIECSLNDGQTSNPTYILIISKIDKKGTCTGSNEPEFSIEKI
tara:strand:+ start:376 stop:882 length:507 start_codon:yes stop_codon:yes gene_type:complete